MDVELLAGLKESFAAEPVGTPGSTKAALCCADIWMAWTTWHGGKSVLAIDYCLTFLGYGTDPDAADEAGLHAAYPYESVYRSEEKALGGDRCARCPRRTARGSSRPTWSASLHRTTWHAS